MKTFGLKFRFAIAMSIGALALVIGMGVVSMHFAQQDLLATLSSQQLGLVSREAQDLDEQLKLASDALLAAGAALPASAIDTPQHFVDFETQNPTLLQIFDAVLVVDRNGIVLADFPVQASRVGLDLGERSYIRRALAGTTPVISEPLIGKVTGLPLVGIAAPIVDGQGEATSLMVGLVRLTKSSILGGLSTTRVGETGYFTVVAGAPEPLYLAHPDASRLMQPVPRATGSAMAGALDATSPGVAVGRLDDGSEALVSYRRLAMTNWTLTAILPGAEAFAVVDRARIRTIRIGVTSALIVLPLVWLFTWLQLRSLDRLRTELNALGGDRRATTFATVGRDEIGRVAEAVNAMLRDQRRSEALRIASDHDRRRLVAILESSQDFVAMADPSGHLIYLNASGRRCRGIGLNDDLRHTTINDHFPAWAVAKLEGEGIPAALKDGIWLGETAVVDAAGREIPVDHTIIAHRNIDGVLEFFSCLLHDTSVAMASSAAMRSSEARMLSIADALPVLVAFIDVGHRYRFVNSRYEDHFGLGKSLMLGRSVADLIGDAAYQVYLPYLQKAAGGATQVFEIESHAGVRPMHFVVKLIPQRDDERTIIGYHFIHQDVTDHKVEQQRLSLLARADALTGLLNRAGFEVAIDEAMSRSRHHGSAMALFYLDVDRFKSINDRYGHPVGDALLRGFAGRLVHAVRSADVVARLGGDEFVVITEGLRNTDDVRAVAQKILRAMGADFEVAGVTLSITASIGIAAYMGESIDSAALIRRADEALYRAKNAGRNRYDLDDPSNSAMMASAVFGEPLEILVERPTATDRLDAIRA